MNNTQRKEQKEALNSRIQSAFAGMPFCGGIGLNLLCGTQSLESIADNLELIQGRMREIANDYAKLEAQVASFNNAISGARNLLKMILPVATETETYWQPVRTIEDAHRFADSGNIIEAVKLVRQLKSISLKEAKDYVDDYRRYGKTPLSQ